MCVTDNPECRKTGWSSSPTEEIQHSVHTDQQTTANIYRNIDSMIAA